MVEQPAFGQRVRQVRRQRGLSQAQVAGVEMSASYVSLVESGRRTPSPELAQTIAERLGLPVTALIAPERGDPRREHRLGLVGRLIMARGAGSSGDHALAREQLRLILDQAIAPEDEDIAWEARWELASTLRYLERHAELEDVLRSLLDDPLTAESGLLYARVATALAELARHRGHLADSLDRAEQAVAAAGALDVTSAERIHATLALVNACGEGGDWKRAEVAAVELLDTVDDIASRQLRGLVCWSAGSACFFAGQADRALTLLDRALTFVLPEVDLRIWARLCTAAAALRLAVGDRSGAEAPLERARSTVELVGTPADRIRLTAVTAVAHRERGDLDAALACVAEVDVDEPGLARQDGARCMVIIARVMAAAGMAEEAADRYRGAAARYEQAGAYRLASLAWRELSEAGEPTRPADRDHHALVMPP